MSKAGEVEEIIAELVAGGLHDPAWIPMPTLSALIRTGECRI
jgi:hypothetical protein